MLNLASDNVLGALGGSATVIVVPEPAALALLALSALAASLRRR
jgi:hypothetical protein